MRQPGGAGIWQSYIEASEVSVVLLMNACCMAHGQCALCVLCSICGRYGRLMGWVVHSVYDKVLVRRAGETPSHFSNQGAGGVGSLWVPITWDLLEMERLQHGLCRSRNSIIRFQQHKQ
jgi:hypothetical protein